MSGAISHQIPLPVELRRAPSLAEYVPGPNTEAVAAVGELLGLRTAARLHLWGPAGSGKTHLLQAACRQAADQGLTSTYLPLDRASELDPGVLSGLENMALVCLDHLDRLAGLTPWQEGLFHLLNRAEESGTRVISASWDPPRLMKLELADLISRLSAGIVLQLHDLDDGQRRRAVQLRAQSRGFEIPDDVAEYLLRRQRRDLPTLMRLVERLDHSTLAAKRRVTIPFVKTLLDD